MLRAGAGEADVATWAEPGVRAGASSAPSAAAKVRGEALYAADLVPTEAAVITLVRSPFAHARLKHLVLDDALSQEGVLDILTGADFGAFRLGHEIVDQPVLAHEKVRYVGEPVVAIAATSAELGRRASEAVRVEYEQLPQSVSITQAAPPEAPVHDESPDNVAKRVTVERGDWSSASAAVDVFVESSFEIGPAQHCYMEPYAAYATFDAADRVIRIHAPTHAPGGIIDDYRAWFDRWSVQVELKAPAIGGAFGAKYEHPLHLICGELARRTGHDVAIVLSRKEDFISANPRNGVRLWVRLGASSTGRLITKEASVVADNGAYSLHGPSVLLATTMRMDNIYRFEAVRSWGELIYTNTPPTQCQRGFGDPEGAFAQEQLLDELAVRLSVNPFEIRAMNGVAPDSTTIHGWQVTSCALDECLRRTELLLSADRARVDATDDARVGSTEAEGNNGFATELDGVGEAGRFAVGWGVGAAMHTVGNRLTTEPDSARVMIRVRPHEIEVDAGEVDVGQGTQALLSKLIVSQLGVEPHEVRIVLGDTETPPLGSGSYSSRTTFFTGNALLDAVTQLKAACVDLEAELGTGSLDPLVLAAEAKRVGIDGSRLECVGEYISERSDSQNLSGDGNRSPSYSFAVHGCRVRVDRWTGTVTVEDYWATHDAGTIIWPQGAAGQVIGGVLQAVGQALSENVVRDADGLMLNSGFLDYRIPTARDAVPITVTFAESPDPEGPLGAKGIAEIPLIPVAACIANAVYDATGIRMYKAPMEPETVLQALRADVQGPPAGALGHPRRADRGCR